MSNIHVVRSDSLTGSKRSDTLAGGAGDSKLRGKQGDDILWGDRNDGGGSDIFIFEKSLASNGMDTIKDYHWTEDGSDGKGQDVLDLFGALRHFKESLERGESVGIEDYAWLEEGEGGMKLLIDQDGPGELAGEQWAFLEGLTIEDAVRVRAFGICRSEDEPDIGDGYFTLGGVTGGHLFVLAQGGLDAVQGGPDLIRDTYWLDDGDGIFDPALDTNVTNATDNVADDADYAGGEWTVEYLGIPGADLIDLTGFGADDHLIVNAGAMNSHLNMWGSADTQTGSAPGFERITTRDSAYGHTAQISWTGGPFLKSGLNKPMDMDVFNTVQQSWPGGKRSSATNYYSISTTPTFTSALVAGYLNRPGQIAHPSGTRPVPLTHLCTNLKFTLTKTSLKASLWAHNSYAFPNYLTRPFQCGYSARTSFYLTLGSGLDNTALPSLQVIWPD